MRPRVFSAGFPLLALALAAIAIAAGAPEPAAPPAPAEDPSILKLAAVLRAEDRRIADDPLRAALSDPSPRVRAAAVRAVGRIGGPGASTLLVAALKDVEASVRVEAAFGLGQLADATALPRLLEAAKDADALARSAVAEALGKIHAPSSADVLATLLLDPDVKVRASACLAAWKFADPSFAVEPLIKASADPDPFSAFAAAYALARLGAEGLEPPSSGAAPGKLGEADRSRVRARLVGLAKSRVAEVRMQAARGLFAPALLQETRALGTLTSDNEIGVRVNAIRSLSFPGAPIDPYVRGALGSRDKAVAYAAAEGLGRISGPMAKDLLGGKELMMPTSTTKSIENAAQISLSLIQDILGAAHSDNFAVRLWDGTTWEAIPGQPAHFTLVLQHPGALRKMFLPPSELNLGEAYIYNDFDIEGDIEAVFPLAQHFTEKGWGSIERLSAPEVADG